MLSFLAPAYLFAAAAAAAGLVAMHFIVRRTPRAMAFPTARFVPESVLPATGWARVPQDLLVLALRVLCVLLAGLALAGPFVQDRGARTSRVVLVDRSRAVADTGEVRDSVAAVARDGDVIMGYASSARVETPGASAPAEASVGGRGSLTPALVAAIRSASALRDRADSVELVIVSTLAGEQLDAATARVRREWPGKARLVRVAGRAATGTLRAPTLVAGEDDAFTAALSSAGARTSAEVRIVRGPLTHADTAWIAAAPGRVVVHWPVEVAPAGFMRRDDRTPAHALLTGSGLVVAPFERPWAYVPALGATPVAWWIDGDVAAAEAAHASGCVRSVAVPVSATGDFVLRHDFHAVLYELIQPCGGAREYAEMPAAALVILRGPAGAAPATAFAAPARDASLLATWLLLASLACALLELAVRARRPPAGVANAAHAAGASVRKVA